METKYALHANDVAERLGTYCCAGILPLSGSGTIPACGINAAVESSTYLVRVGTSWYPVLLVSGKKVVFDESAEELIAGLLFCS